MPRKNTKNSKATSLTYRWIELAVEHGHLHQLPFRRNGDRITLDISLAEVVALLPEEIFNDFLEGEPRKTLTPPKATKNGKVKVRKAETTKEKAATANGRTNEQIRNAVIRKLELNPEGLGSAELKDVIPGNTEKRKQILNAMIKDGLLDTDGQARGMKYLLAEKAKAELASTKKSKTAPKEEANPQAEPLQAEPTPEKESEDESEDGES